jgi:hypothetical protein
MNITNTKKETNVLDSEGRMIFEGDTIECSCPVYETPKNFKVQWDKLENRYNLPKSSYILSYCKIIKENHV